MCYQPFNPLLRVGTKDEGALEHDVKEKEEDGEAPYLVGHDAVYHTGECFAVLVLLHESFFQCARDKAVFGIGDGLFAVFVHRPADAFGFPVAYLDDFCAVGKGRDDVLLDILVVFQQLDGQEAGGVFVTDVLVLADFFLYGIDTALQFRSVVDVDVADIAFRVKLLYFFFLAPELMVGHVLVVPLA